MKIIFKQLAGLAIGLRHKSARNLNLLTQVKIMASLLAYLAVTVASLVFLVQYVKEKFLENINQSLITEPDTVYPVLVNSFDTEVTPVLNGIIFLATLITLALAILLIRLALYPLREAFAMQKSFISGIAHEIRTPLSILRMNNEIAKFEVDEPSPMNDLLDENLSDIDKINEILNNLLLFDRMGSLDLLQMLEKNDLLGIAREVATQFRDLSAQKKIGIFISEGISNIPPVIGNKTAIEQVFFNLIKNAMLYTQSGGRITITCSEVTREHVSIKVSDTGVGIAKKDLARIFEPFYRSEKTGKLSGTGIGLAIVFEIMKMHKGSIEVESIEGVGTSFSLSFPIRPRSSVKQFLFNPVSKLFYDFSKRRDIVNE